MQHAKYVEQGDDNSYDQVDGPSVTFSNEELYQARISDETWGSAYDAFVAGCEWNENPYAEWNDDGWGYTPEYHVHPDDRWSQVYNALANEEPPPLLPGEPKEVIDADNTRWTWCENQNMYIGEEYDLSLVAPW